MSLRLSAIAILSAALILSNSGMGAGIVPPPVPDAVQFKLDSLLTCSARAQPHRMTAQVFDFCGAHVGWEPRGESQIKACFTMNRFWRMVSPPPMKGRPEIPTYQFWFHCPDEPHSELIVTIRETKMSDWTIELEQFYPL